MNVISDLSRGIARVNHDPKTRGGLALGSTIDIDIDLDCLQSCNHVSNRRSLTLSCISLIVVYYLICDKRIWALYSYRKHTISRKSLSRV